MYKGVNRKKRERGKEKETLWKDKRQTERDS